MEFTNESSKITVQPLSQVLHSAIESKDNTLLDKAIKTLLADNDDKLALNTDKESAVAVALKTKYFDGYELLIKNNFRLTNNEKLEEIIVDYDKQDKGKLRDIHIENAIKPPQDYLKVIYSKCRLVHTTSEENRKNFEVLKVEVFEKLAAIEWIRLLLTIASFSDSLQIIFDFDRNSVDHIDPTMKTNCLGLCFYNIGDILIGAKGLLTENSDEYYKVLGVLAHEVCHYVMQLVYGNDTKPYHEFDSENKEKFEKILKKSEINKIEEDIIRLVFNESIEVQHCELIVRVVQLMARYSSEEDRKKLTTVQKTFFELFEYFEEKVVPDLKLELPKMEAKLKLKEINEICGLHFDLQYATPHFTPESWKSFQNSFLKNDSAEKVQILTSNCVRMTVKAIFTVYLENDQLDGKILVKTESLKSEKISEMILSATKKYETSMIVVECSEKDENFRELLKPLTENNQNTKIVFVIPASLEPLLSKTNVVEHSWSDLTETFQKKLLKTQTNFQGFTVELSQVLIQTSETIKSIDLNELIPFKSAMKIGIELDFDDNKVYIPRKFLESNAKWNLKYQKYQPDAFELDEAFFKDHERKCFLLVDEGGNGKSTEFKKISIKLKNKFPSHWVTYIDLKKYTEAFQKNGSSNIDDFGETATYFAQKVLKLKIFEAILFTELFKTDRVIFLLDGVDEISPSYDEFVTKLIIQIKDKSNNQLWIATRPHLKKKLELKLAAESFKLMKFSKYDRELFFLMCFESFDANARQVMYSKILDLLFRIENSKFWKINPDAEVLNPMLLKMIADLFMDDPNFEPAKANLFAIYDGFINKLYRKLSEKGDEAIDDSVKFMRNVKINDYHQKKAFEKMFPDGKECSHVAEIFRHVKKITIDQQIRIGIINTEENENCNFIHKTFAEFFIAQYFFEVIFKKSVVRKEVGELFCQMITYEKHKFFRRFLEDQLNVKDINEGLKMIEHLRECFGAQNFFIRVLQPTLYLLYGAEGYNTRFEDNRLKRVLCHLFKEECLSLIKLVSISVKNYNPDMMKWWGESLNRTTVTSSFLFIKKLWVLAVELFKKDQRKIILIKQTSLGRNILHCSLKNEDEKVFKFFFNKGPIYFTASELETFLFPKLPLWDSSKIIRDLNRCEKNLKEDDFKKLLMTSKQNGQTLLHRACSNDNDDDFTIAADFLKQNLLSKEVKEMMLKVTNFKESVLMIAAKSKNKERFEQVWEFTTKIFSETELNNFLLLENRDGLNVLYFSTLN